MRRADLDRNQHPPSLRILSVADFDWRNGHEFTLQALHLLKERRLPFEFSLLGNGPFLEAVAFARHALDLETEVQLILQPDAKRLAEAYARADIFLLAAVAPGAGHGLTEASRRHLPIVCTDIFGNTVSHTATIIVPRRDPIQIAEALASSLQQSRNLQVA